MHGSGAGSMHGSDYVTDVSDIIVYTNYQATMFNKVCSGILGFGFQCSTPHTTT